MTAIYERPFESLLQEAVAFHGHLCPGQVLGVRMVTAGCRALGVAHPHAVGKSLVVFVEIDRCATDAIQALTGVSLGRRTLKHIDVGKMAATFVNMVTGRAVRVRAREEAREHARRLAPAERDARRGQIVAYRTMAESELLDICDVAIVPGWLDRPRGRVACAACGEGVNYAREVVVRGRVLCRPCAGEPSYFCDARHEGRATIAATIERGRAAARARST